MRRYYTFGRGLEFADRVANGFSMKGSMKHGIKDMRIHENCDFPL